MRRLTRRSPAGTQPRGRRRARNFVRAMIRAATMVSALAGVMAGVWWYLEHPGRIPALADDLVALESRSEEEIRRLGTELGLVVSRVTVAGRVNTPKEALWKALDLHIGGPMLAVRPDALRERVEGLGWVARATVERHLPDTIRITLVERTPAASWWHEGRKLLIDARGVVIGADTEGRWSHLKPVIGADAPAHAGDLLAMLDAHPEIRNQVVAAVRTGGRRWTLNLDNGIDVHLPEQDAEAALGRLARYAAERWLFDREIVAIDMRLEDRIAVRPLKPPKRRRGPGEI